MNQYPRFWFVFIIELIIILSHMYEEKSSILSEEQISEKIEIYISGRNLNSKGIFPTTDSFLVVHLGQPDRQEKQILKTKVYWNTLNPNYVETLSIDFVFEIKQRLRFEIFQQGKPAKLIGSLETSVGQIFGSPTNGFIKPIKNEKDQETGKIILRCEKIEKGKRRTFNAQLSAEGLPNFTWLFFFGGTFPFFRIFRKRKEDELLLYESEVLGHTLNPTWKQFRISEYKLCKLDDKMEIQIRFYSFLASGNHNLIGSAFFTLQKLKKDQKIPIKLNRKQARGALTFKKMSRTIKHQFGEYIENGLQLALTTCIDFTASNGSHQTPSSLHYFTNSKKSPYEEAMSEVLDILLEYDYDKLVPCFGFGAQVRHPKIHTNGKVHHCFPLNCSVDNPNIYQKENIIKEYRKVFEYLKFSGPTKFSQLLKEAMQICSQFKNNPDKTEYMILFILTDGEIHDKLEVIDLLIQCDKLPLSIIIVGIGNGNFQIMNQLDDDDCKMMDSKGNKTNRDLVQFVEFKKFKNNGVALAREVLQELPRQAEQYFELMKIEPSEMKRRKADIEMQMWLNSSNA